MLINYLKTTLRAIRKNPIYGLLNIAGLALGIACAALIFLWVEDDLVMITRCQNGTNCIPSG